MRSDTIKRGFDKTPHRSLLRATGLKDEDFDKPFIGVANSHIDIIPGTFSSRSMAASSKRRSVKPAVYRSSSIRSGSMTVSRWAMTECSILCRLEN